jgi:DNA-binding response OmpR family regulator
MRVLLVDDEADLASTLAERLQMRGIDADWADTAEKALALARGQAYDLAVLDIKMPKVGGVALKAQLNALSPQTKVIFLTGYGSEKDFKEVADCIGDDCYLVKPVDIQVLITQMQRMVNGQEGDHDDVD